jgi:2-oxoglutarate ferredoxin oxidoreductase subunit alpha
MSRVRGGHNFTFLRIGDEDFDGHDADKVHLIAAFDRDSATLHQSLLVEDGRMLCEGKNIPEAPDERFMAVPLEALAQEAGNSKVVPTVMVGVICRMLGLALGDDYLAKAFAGRDADANIAAYHLGFQRVEDWKRIPVNEKYQNVPLLNGNEAAALGCVAAGCGFYCAYPMTPATSVMTFLAAHTDQTGMIVEQAEDEIAAINMAIGASYAGTRSMTGTSGGGFCLMTEGVSLAAMHELPLVILNSQRPGPATGLPTRTEQADLEMVLHAGHGEFARVVLSVRNPADAYRQTMRAFYLADKYQLPVVILTDEYLADTKVHREAFTDDTNQWFQFFLDVEEDPADEYLRYRLTESGISPRRLPGVGEQVVIVDSDEHSEAGHITESAKVRRQMVEKRNVKHQALLTEVEEPDYFGAPVPDVLLYGWGSLWGPLRDAVRLLQTQPRQLKVGCLCFGDIWPLPTARLWQLWGQAGLHICAEQNYSGQLARLLTANTGLVEEARINCYDGRQLSGRQIASRVLEVVSQWK